MEEGYKEFVEKLRLALMEAMGISEEKIYFEEKGGPYTETGDKLFVECAENENAKEVCGLYTGDLYERFQSDVSINEIVESVMMQIERAASAEFLESTKRLMDYQKAKEHLFVRTLNFQKHKESLKDAVYCPVGDIALVLYMKVMEEGGIISSTKILKSYVLNWGKSCVEVFEEGLKNTYRVSHPRIYTWQKLLCDPRYEGEDFMEEEPDFYPGKDVRGNCLSTTGKVNGAIAIFLPGVAQRLSDMLEDDLYLAFTSVHEVMVHSVDSVYLEDLKEVLEETIREATPEEDYLTSNVYHYSRTTRQFTCM